LCPTRAAVDSRWLRSAFLALLLGCAAPVLAQPPAAITLLSRSVQQGELVLVTFGTPPSVDAVSVAAFAVEWPAYRVDERTWRAVIGIDLEQRPGRYDLTVTGMPASPGWSAHRRITVLPRRFPRRVLRVAPEYVNPSPDQLTRIAEEAAFLRNLYEHSAPEPAWSGGFIRPVPQRANSSFGTRSVFNGEARRPHAGADFLSPAGTPVHAPASGQVVAARDLFFTGNTVVIDHGRGMFSTLAHLSRVDVAEGQPVSAGETVGVVGATGRVTGPHLHWAVRVGPARVDPLSALAILPTAQ